MYAPSSPTLQHVLLSKVTNDRTKASFLSFNVVLLFTGVISHNGYDSCLKCTEHSVYDEVTHRMYFSRVDAPKRITKEFKEGKYKRHCKNSTPLTALDYFDIIDDVPTTDRLHLIDLGVMRYLMRSSKKGTFGQLYKWNLEDIEYISSVMDKMKIPSEVPRKLRSIHYLKFWKGAEFKNFLHYPSIVALKDTLPEAAYEHFKLFFCAITIFSSPVHDIFRKKQIIGVVYPQI